MIDNRVTFLDYSWRKSRANGVSKAQGVGIGVGRVRVTSVKFRGEGVFSSSIFRAWGRDDHQGSRLRNVVVLAIIVALGFAAPLIAPLSAMAQPQTKQQTQAEESADDEDRPPQQGQPLAPRSRQNIDEPRLTPMFARRRRDSSRFDDDEPEYIDDENADENDDNAFTGILTLLTPSQTDLSLGVGPVYRPDYFGSDDYIFDADPQVFLRVRNFVFFDDDGADLALFGFSGFSLGPSIRIVGERSEDDNPALTGLGTVGTTFELGGFVSTTFVDRFNVRFKVRKGLRTGHRGLIVDAFGTALLFRRGRFSSSVSAQATWIGDDYADAFFSVTPEQSLASGLNEFDARSGIRNIGGSLNGYINLGRKWSVNPYVTYDLVVGNVADTPIIADLGSRNQFRAGFHIIRQFRLFDR